MTMAQDPASSGASEDSLTELMATLRVYGSILYTTNIWQPREGTTPIDLEPAHINGWMKSCAAAGVTTVLWRSNTGWTTYPSKYVPLAGSFALPPKHRFGTQEIDQSWQAEDWAFLGEQCNRFDTLALAVEAAHRHGMKIYLDFATFDAIGVWCNQNYWPQGGKLAWDPDMWLWSRDQEKRLAGVPCYAEPAVRQLKVREIDEVTDYDIDGVVVSLVGHMDGTGGDEPCAFGFNPTVVEQYRRRHGVDPLTGDVDPHKFYALHGEGFTEFIGGASQVVRGKGRRFIAATRTDGVHGWGGAEAGKALIGQTMPQRDMRDGQSPLPLAAGFYLETEKWVEQKLVDALMCAAPYNDGVNAAKQLRDRLAIPVYLWRKYTAVEGEVYVGAGFDDFRSEVETVRNGQLDGYAMFLPQITEHPMYTPDWREIYGTR